MPIVCSNVSTKIHTGSRIYRLLQEINQISPYEIVVEEYIWMERKWFKKAENKSYDIYSKISDAEASELAISKSERETESYIEAMLVGIELHKQKLRKEEKEVVKA